eukprot:1271553-Amphidinium_carterae.1
MEKTLNGETTKREGGISDSQGGYDFKVVGMEPFTISVTSRVDSTRAVNTLLRIFKSPAASDQRHCCVPTRQTRTWPASKAGLLAYAEPFRTIRQCA